jgi:hypothetical protein
MHRDDIQVAAAERLSPTQACSGRAPVARAAKAPRSAVAMFLPLTAFLGSMLMLAGCASAGRVDRPLPRASVRSDQDIADEFVRKQQGEDEPEYREARKYLRGDLTGDGIDDLVVQFTLEEGNFWRLFLAVFRGPGFTDVKVAQVGGKSWRTVDIQRIEELGVVAATAYYGEGDALCCPSLSGSTVFELRKGLFGEVGAQFDAVGRADDE